MDDVYSGRKGKKCVIYIRVSSERQVQGYSLEGQKRYLKEWAEFEGMTVSEIYVEPGKSGKSISGREVFQQMLEDISTGRVDIDYVVVFKLSRFGRNAKDILNSLTYIKRYGVNLICKEDGLDSSTAMGRMMITILGAVAEMERENILVQTMLGREEKAKQGGWNGGFAPYGYELVDGKLEIKEDEAVIVKLIFDKFVNDGIGYSTIAGYLNRQGVPKLPSRNSHGRSFTDWSVHHIKRMLDNPVYTGRVVFGRTRLEKVVGTENEYRRVKSDEYIMSENIVHEPIISDELFEKAQVKRRETTTTGNPSVGRGSKHLLSGILKCPMCGSSMYAEIRQWTNKDGTKNQKRNYQCGHYAKSRFGQCKKNTIFADWIEAEVIEYTKLLVRNPQFAEDIQRQIGQKVDVSELDAEIANYRKRLKRLERSKSNLERDIDDIADEDRNAERKRQDMNRRLNKLYEEIYNVENQITDCERKKAAVEQDALTRDGVYKMLLAFDKFFDKMSKEDQRKMMECLVSEVHLYPKETWEESKNPIKDIKYTFPVSKEVMESLGENVASVETVVMLSHKKPDSVINVKVEFGEGEGKVPLDNIAKRAEAYKPKERVTYKMIKEYIEAKYGFKVHTAYIAEVKRELGLPMYDAPNAVEELKQPRKHPTAEKVEAIKDALKHFEVIVRPRACLPIWSFSCSEKWKCPKQKTTRCAGARRLLYKKSPFRYNRGVQATIRERKGDFMAKQTNSLAHTKWMCKYHIIFTPKYRRKIVYNQYKVDLRDILKQLCSYKGVEIIEGHLMPDHVHMLVSIPPKISVSSFMGYLKGKSALMMFDRHANLKYKFGNRHFWSEGYYVSTVGLNEATIKKYIQDQEKADILQDKLSVKEYEDPFKG